MHFNRENIFDQVEEARFARYRKTAVTRAYRIYEPFTVETREGVLSCPDGYLALDSQGYPYPVAADAFEMMYEPEFPIKR